MRALLLAGLVVVSGCGKSDIASAPPEPSKAKTKVEEREVAFNHKDEIETLQWFTSEFKKSRDFPQENRAAEKKAVDAFNLTVSNLAKSGLRVEWKVKCASISADGMITIQDLHNRTLRISVVGPEDRSFTLQRFKWTGFDMHGKPWLETTKSGDEFHFRGKLSDIVGWDTNCWAFIFIDADLEPVK